MGVSIAALTTATVVAAVIGAVFSTSLPHHWISIGAGILFIILGVASLLRRKSDGISCESSSGAFAMYSLILSSELGDKSELAILALSANFAAPIFVILGAVVAFALITTLGAFAGNRMAARTSTGVINAISGVAFILLGVITLWITLLPVS